uniref:Uncharacterized protein n=2 Tax=Ditylum brightwellii TaxID=49249 RepID=A0A7S4VC96_9STRA
MSLWTLGQDHQFFRHPQRNPIAGILMKELAITPVQARKIIEHRHRIRNLCDNIKQCMTLIRKLQNLCKHKHKIFNGRMTKCQEILTPLQVVKLLHWIDEHSGTLESVCPGWGSERIRVRNKSAASTAAVAVDGTGGDGSAAAAADVCNSATAGVASTEGAMQTEMENDFATKEMSTQPGQTS